MEGSGGPGLGRSQSAAGIVNTNHQRPTRKRTIRRVKVVDMFMEPATTTIVIPRACTITAAMYPIPMPYDDIWVDSRSAGDTDIEENWLRIIRRATGDDCKSDSVALS